MAHFSVDSIDLFKCSYISRITKKDNASFQQTHTHTGKRSGKTRWFYCIRCTHIFWI